MLLWGLGIATLNFSQVVVLPDVVMLQQMTELLQSFSPVLMAAIGGNRTFTPEGFIAVQQLFLLPLIFSVYAVVSGLSVTANDEDQGVMDMVLAAPVPRWRLLVEKTLAYVPLIIGLVLCAYIATALAIVLGQKGTVDISRIAAGTFTLIPPMLFLLMFTVMIAAFTRRRNFVIAFVSIFVLFSFFVDTLSRAAPGTIFDSLKIFSYFYHYDGVNVVVSGVNAGSILLLLVTALLCCAIAMFSFQRRDIGR